MYTVWLAHHYHSMMCFDAPLRTTRSTSDLCVYVCVCMCVPFYFYSSLWFTFRDVAFFFLLFAFFASSLGGVQFLNIIFQLCVLVCVCAIFCLFKKKKEEEYFPFGPQ